MADSLTLLAHRSLALRQFGDLDVLLRKEDSCSSLQVPPAISTHTMSGKDALPLHRPASARSRKDAVLVELHASLMPEAFPFPLDFENIRTRLQPVILAGREVLTLSSEDLLLLLCAHGSKHFWRCLGWIYDIALLIRNQTIDWQRVLSEARRLACQRMLFLGLNLATGLLHVPVPAEIQQRIQGCPKVQALAEQVRHNLAGPGQRIGGFASSLFHFHVRERWRDGIWTCQSLALARQPSPIGQR